MDRHTQIYWNTTLSCCVCLFSIYSFNRRLVAVLQHTRAREVRACATHWRRNQTKRHCLASQRCESSSARPSESLVGARAPSISIRLAGPAQDSGVLRIQGNVARFTRFSRLRDGGRCPVEPCIGGSPVRSSAG